MGVEGTIPRHCRASFSLSAIKVTDGAAWEYVWPAGAGVWLHGATLCYRRALWEKAFAAVAKIASSVCAMPISYEVISALPIKPSSLLASYAIGFR